MISPALPPPSNIPGYTATAAGRGLQVAMEGVWSAIERGGALNDLSNRTGESVRNLYQLEEAFKVIGISSDATGPMILKLQRALSGTSEGGEKTDKLFASLGLNMKQLQGMEGPAQITAISNAIAGLNKNDASEVASKIFGREGAGAILQIGRNVGEFSDSLKATAPAAAVVARTAAAFNQIGNTINTVKGKLAGFWAGAAEGAQPQIQKILNWLNKIDFVKAGEGLGTFMRAIGNAFGNGELSLLVGESLRVGFETAVDFAWPVFEKLGAILLSVFKTPLNYLQAGLVKFSEETWELMDKTLGKIPGMQAHLVAPKGFKARSFGEIMAEQRESGPQFDLGSGQFGIAEINADANKRSQEAKAAAAQRLEKFWKGVRELAGPNGNFAPAPKDDGKGKGTLSPDVGGGRKTEGSALEKIGFTFNGGRTVNDHSRDTASNTRRTNEILTKLPKAIVAAMSTSSGGDFANI